MSKGSAAPVTNWPALLAEACAELASSCPELATEFAAPLGSADTRERFGLLLERVTQWNKRLDLTAARDERQLVDLYLTDALVLAAAAQRELPAAAAAAGSWLEVGSGGGAPGLALKLLEPRLRLWLIEPRAKRVAFLRSAAGSLGLSALRIDCQRSDVLPARACDVAFSRATFTPAEWLAEGARLARGAVWVLLARGDAPEHAGWRLERQIAYCWPFSGAERRALRYVPSP
jgi:16S rRNA (guanine527-N7)-methyltransferase